MKNTFLAVILGFVYLLSMQSKSFAQVLETEESKPLLPGQFEIGTGVEFQTSEEGTETAIPLAFEFGISKKLSLLIEPVVFTSINPKNNPNARGIGDLEISLFYQIVSENKVMPSISIAGEVKIPTANNRMIGTGKTDYTPFIIASKTTGPFFSSINIGYTFVGKPDGVDAADLFNYSAGTIFTVSPKSILYAEVYGNTSAFGGEGDKSDGSDNITTNENKSELSGNEIVGVAGLGYYIKPNLLISLGVSYDNNNAVLIHPGIQWKFGGK